MGERPVSQMSDKDAAYRKEAKAQYESEGSVEIDSNALVSKSDEGAYIQAWVWVYAFDVDGVDA